MADMTRLNGASVKDANGRTGRVVSISEAAVSLTWLAKGIVAEEQSVQRNSIPKGIKILTIKEGWTSLDTVAGLHEPSLAERTVTDLQSLLEGKHSPYKHISTQGPAAGGSGTRETSKQDKWVCHKSGSDATYVKQKCKAVKKDASGKLHATGKIKNIKIKRSYKKKYNHEYKPWRSKQGW